MEKYHVVRINKGYHLMKTFQTFQSAASFLFQQNLNSGPVVMREGETGKRYSWFEVENILKGTPLDDLDVSMMEMGNLINDLKSIQNS
jgi:hypothetical protein